MRMTFPALLLASAIALPGTLAAQPSAAPQPPPLHPTEIMAAFIHLQTSISADVDETRKSDPPSAASLERAAAALLGVGPGQYSRLNALSRTVKLQLDNLAFEQRRYLASRAANNQRPDLAVLEGFVQKRRNLLAAALDGIRLGMSTSEWQAFVTFLNQLQKQTLVGHL